jgi:hypothetical protein
MKTERELARFHYHVVSQSLCTLCMLCFSMVGASPAPTLYEPATQSSRVGAGLAPALEAARHMAIDLLQEVVNLTPMGPGSSPPWKKTGIRLREAI